MWPVLIGSAGEHQILKLEIAMTHLGHTGRTHDLLVVENVQFLSMQQYIEGRRPSLSLSVPLVYVGKPGRAEAG